MRELLDQLRREHASILAVLGVLERQVGIFAAAEHPDYELMQAALDYCLGFPERYHHPKEDMVFDGLVRRDPAAAAAFGDLRAAHARLTQSLLGFASALHAVVADAEVPRDDFVRRAADFIALQRQHILAEETRFFPVAAEALTAQDWRDIADTLTLTADPLGKAGASGDARFEALRREILQWQG